jgi:hypothetical protein
MVQSLTFLVALASLFIQFGIWLINAVAYGRGCFFKKAILNDGDIFGVNDV